MPTSAIVPNRRAVLALLALAVAVPFPASAQPNGPGFLTPDQIYTVDEDLDKRIARYEEVLAKQVLPDASTDKHPYVAPLTQLVLDFSTMLEPEEAVKTACGLSTAKTTRKVYEETGVTLLSAARLARFGGDTERALRYLKTADHLFDLALEARQAEGAPVRETDFLHRAMVRLEEILVTDSNTPWSEAEQLLRQSLQLFPTGPQADWAWRILDDPTQYVAEIPSPYVGPKEVDPEDAVHFVGGDVQPPVKIFAPAEPLYTELARRARVQGVVIVQVVIDRHGTISALRVLKGLFMGLTEEALKTMATWLFEPARLDGRPVAVYYNLTINFRLQ